MKRSFLFSLMALAAWCVNARADGLTSPTHAELGNVLLQGNSAPNYPANFYLAVMSSAVADNGTGGAEVSFTGYARQAIPRSASAWTFASPANWTNASTVAFPAPATGTYTAVQVALFDAATGGNCKATFSFPSAYTVGTGQALSFGPGTIALNLIPTAVSALQVRVSWNASSDPTAVGYKVHWGTTSGTYTNSADAGTALTYIITGLTIGQTIYFVVDAYNQYGTEGAVTSQLSYTP